MNSVDWAEYFHAFDYDQDIAGFVVAIDDDEVSERIARRMFDTPLTEDIGVTFNLKLEEAEEAQASICVVKDSNGQVCPCPIDRQTTIAMLVDQLINTGVLPEGAKATTINGTTLTATLSRALAGAPLEGMRECSGRLELTVDKPFCTKEAPADTEGTVNVAIDGGLAEAIVNILNGVTTLLQAISAPEVAHKANRSVAAITNSVVSLNGVTVEDIEHTVVHNGDQIVLSARSSHSKAC